MTFAIDFDGTMSRDPALFHKFVAICRDSGHECVIVTGRSDEGGFGDEVRRVANGLPIVFAGRRWKMEAARKSGWFVDIWIDDNPQYVAPQTIL